MNVSLTPELEKFVQAKVATGLYTSASEVIRESLRLMNSQGGISTQKLYSLNQAISVGMTQLEKGKKVSAKKIYARLKKKISAK